MANLMQPNDQAPILVWLRRDLRLHDHAALNAALGNKGPIQLVFIFDTTILHKIPGWQPGRVIDDRRVGLIHAALEDIAQTLQQLGGALLVKTGNPSELIPEIAQKIRASCVIAAHDDEPAARQRDEQVSLALQSMGIGWTSVKDQCIFERHEVLTGAAKPFSVFTPYKNAWLKRLTPEDIAEKATGAKVSEGRIVVHNPLKSRLVPQVNIQALKLNLLPSLESMGFSAGNLQELGIPLGAVGAHSLFNDFKSRIKDYKAARDFPGIKGPSYLSMHLRFGTISIRELVRFAIDTGQDSSQAEGSSTWLSELIWRDFYMQILFHHPHVASRSFKPDYDNIQWLEGPESDRLFQAWCDGETGFPLVDAGMRQLNATGYMHNRLRMVVASFLTKDLGIDWRRGEAYFAWKLNDFDLSANNGGWQWAASSGCDAQPYFRIFNPTTQSEKFDPKGTFIRRYVPEVAALPDRWIHAPWEAPDEVLKAQSLRLGEHYPRPIVMHDQARVKTLLRYSVVKKADV
jgi:deoxyribodipyrimidine photo-lyase